MSQSLRLLCCVDSAGHFFLKRHIRAQTYANAPEQKNGTPFWNLVFVARLVGPDGALEYHLGGQLNVTDMLGREEDLLDVLKYVPPRTEGPSAAEDFDEQDKRASWRSRPSDRTPGRGWESQSKYPPSTSLNGFLKSFRRRCSSTRSSESENQAEMSSADPSTPIGRRGTTQVSNCTSTCCDMPVVSPFSRYMVLQYVRPSRAHGNRKEKRCEPELPVAFCSRAMLDSLGGSKCTSDILGQDVFDVLSENGGTSITKSFRYDVRDGLANGRTAKLKLGMKLGGGRPKRTRGISISRKSSIVGSSSVGEPFDQGRSSRSSFSRERLIPSISISEAAEDYATYWTPLMDASRVARWVVVILVPEVE